MNHMTTLLPGSLMMEVQREETPLMGAPMKQLRVTSTPPSPSWTMSWRMRNGRSELLSSQAPTTRTTFLRPQISSGKCSARSRPPSRGEYRSSDWWPHVACYREGGRRGLDTSDPTHNISAQTGFSSADNSFASAGRSLGE